MYTITPDQLESITDVECAFGTTRLLPNWNDIPEEFVHGNAFTRLASSLFYGTELPDIELIFNEGFQDSAAALNRAVRAHLQSRAPMHEHKIAGVGYLMSKVFRIQSRQ